MDKLFLDANVVVDFLCERSDDFYLPVARLMVKSYNKEVELCCSTLTLATASYFMEKGKIDHEEIFHKIYDMISICELADVDRDVVEKALSSGFSDFEDALQYFSAENFGADIIITRNKKDFRNAQLPVYTPLEYLEMSGV
jgi:predicted nucleic-acid-binding protein